jgi:hypothetical protein
MSWYEIRLEQPLESAAWPVQLSTVPAEYKQARATAIGSGLSRSVRAREESGTTFVRFHQIATGDIKVQSKQYQQLD